LIEHIAPPFPLRRGGLASMENGHRDPSQAASAIINRMTTSERLDELMVSHRREARRCIRARAYREATLMQVSRMSVAQDPGATA
jgi:hypothetical protein